MDNTTLYYFGTDLREAGHYFFELKGNDILWTPVAFGNISFDPERMPLWEKGNPRRGDAAYYEYNDGDKWYSIWAIEGSCYDKRPGSHSVFFVMEETGGNKLKDLILNTPIAKRIIEQMPFDIKW